MSHPWIAQRTEYFDSSGIRKVFDLARSMSDPINLSIGQPDFDVPEPIKAAAERAMRAGKNGYSPTQGIAELGEKLSERVKSQYNHPTRQLFVTSGTSGGLVLAVLALVNPGDEVIVFDPYFVMYKSLVGLVGGRAVLVDTYPDFRIDLDKVAAAMTRRTKAVLFNSPANPTGVTASLQETRGLAELCAERNVALVSDEIYNRFSYDQPFVSPARFNPDTLVIDGFSKTYGMTGWRLGFAHGPAEVIQQMIKLQQYTFVCAPQPVQWAGIAALDVDVQSHIDDYRRKRDMISAGLAEHYEFVRPAGAFYVFPKAPWGNGEEFVHRAIENKLLVIPGNIFSERNTHFRISYAAPDKTLQRGIEVLRKLARG
jgi:aspartate aminotransferase/aminotransferase